MPSSLQYSGGGYAKTVNFKMMHMYKVDKYKDPIPHILNEDGT